jgi:hypothetical protein
LRMVAKSEGLVCLPAAGPAEMGDHSLPFPVSAPEIFPYKYGLIAR